MKKIGYLAVGGFIFFAIFYTGFTDVLGIYFEWWHAYFFSASVVVGYLILSAPLIRKLMSKENQKIRDVLFESQNPNWMDEILPIIFYTVLVICYLIGVYWLSLL